MAIPYRVRRTFRRAGSFLLVSSLVIGLAGCCGMAWLDRYKIHNRDGSVTLDFDKSSQDITGRPAMDAPDQQEVSIYYNEGENAINVSKELTKLKGYYITEADLEKGLGEVRQQVLGLESGTPVMVDVKNIAGKFFYSSTVGENRNTVIDPAAMDEFLDFLDSSGMYTIARLPALRDYYYGLDHVSDGLPTSGGYLWMDGNGCYWLNPASQGTMAYLVRIVTELKGLGFDEVVFYDFCFPETDRIVFSGDKQQALTTAAQTLVQTCATESFAVSFVGDVDFVRPEGRSRLFVENITAGQASDIAQQVELPDVPVYLVFITELYDTRFEEYGVMRPISGAH